VWSSVNLLQNSVDLYWELTPTRMIQIHAENCLSDSDVCYSFSHCTNSSVLCMYLKISHDEITCLLDYVAYIVRQARSVFDLILANAHCNMHSFFKRTVALSHTMEHYYIKEDRLHRYMCLGWDILDMQNDQLSIYINSWD